MIYFNSNIANSDRTINGSLEAEYNHDPDTKSGVMPRNFNDPCSLQGEFNAYDVWECDILISRNVCSYNWPGKSVVIAVRAWFVLFGRGTCHFGIHLTLLVLRTSYRTSVKQHMYNVQGLSQYQWHEKCLKTSYSHSIIYILHCQGHQQQWPCAVRKIHLFHYNTL